MELSYWELPELFRVHFMDGSWIDTTHPDHWDVSVSRVEPIEVTDPHEFCGLED